MNQWLIFVLIVRLILFLFSSILKYNRCSLSWIIYIYYGCSNKLSIAYICVCNFNKASYVFFKTRLMFCDLCSWIYNLLQWRWSLNLELDILKEFLCLNMYMRSMSDAIWQHNMPQLKESFASNVQRKQINLYYFITIRFVVETRF
jgi:hypothetical protein